MKKNNTENIKSELEGSVFFDGVEPKERPTSSDTLSTTSELQVSNEVSKQVSDKDNKILNKVLSFYPTKRTRRELKQAIELLNERLDGKGIRVGNSEIVNALIEEADLLSEEAQDRLYNRIRDKLISNW